MRDASVFAEVFMKAKELSLANNAEQPGDFYRDGLLCCGKCGARKQYITKNPIDFKKDFIVGVPCLCKLAEKRDAEARDKKREHDIYVADLNRRCFDSRYFTAMTFENSDTKSEAVAICEDYCQTYQNHRGTGAGLLLYGGVGTGKTYLAAAVCNDLMNQGVPCKMITFSELANQLLSGFDKMKIMNELNEYEVLVIDDLGVERDSGYMSELIETVIDRRCRIKYPIIVTTNLTPETMDHPNNIARERLYSRLAAMTIPVNVKGRDRRKQ